MNKHTYTVKKNRSFRNKKGTLVHVYLVNGNDAAIARFKEVQGENLRTYQELDAQGQEVDHPLNGTPLFFSTTEIAQGGTILETLKGGFAVDQGSMGNIVREEIRNSVKAFFLQSMGSPSDVHSGTNSADDTMDSPKQAEQVEGNKKNMKPA